MDRKIILTSMLLMLGMAAFPAESWANATPDAAISAEQPPYKYRQRGIKTKLEDLSGGAGTAAKAPATGKSGQDSKAASAQKKKGSQVQQSGKKYVAMKTNIAHYAGAVANLGVEVQLHPHFTLDMPVNLSFWDMEREHGIRTVLFQPEARWWPKGAGQGHFIGVHAHVAGFNVQWNDWRYQSAGRPLLGAGISYGYSLRISDHWNFEFNLGAGYANMPYDRFYNIDNGARNGGGVYEYWGITRLGLSLVYKF